MKLVGKVSIYKNGKLIEESENTIHDNLKAYFRDLMDSPSDQAINALFTNDGVAHGGGTGGQDAKDGILINQGSWVTTITTTLTENNAYGKRWKGEYTNNSGVSQTVTAFRIGHNFNGDGTFEYRYATYNPADFTLQDQDSVIIEWEVYIN